MPRAISQVYKLEEQAFSQRTEDLTPDEAVLAVTSPERRTKARISVPFHALVRGVDELGEEFVVETVVDNLSGAGLYLRMMPQVEKGRKLSIALGLRANFHITEDAPHFMINGTVLRREQKVGGVSGVAVVFDRVRLM